MIYINGSYHTINDENHFIDVRDRGFLLGDGIFETILVHDGQPVFLQDHIDRLNEACIFLKIPMSLDLPEVTQIISHLHSGMGNNHIECSARISVSRGMGARGLLFPDKAVSSPTLVISIDPIAKSAAKFTYKIRDYRRAETSLSARFKTLNYLDNIMARNDAASSGFNEAIMCNSHGRIACGSYTNIFLIDEEGCVRTPALSEGALNGITRRKILSLAKGLNIPIVEGKIEVQHIQSNGCFFSNSLIGIVPDERLECHEKFIGAKKTMTKLLRAYMNEIKTNKDRA